MIDILNNVSNYQLCLLLIKSNKLFCNYLNYKKFLLSLVFNPDNNGKNRVNSRTIKLPYYYRNNNFKILFFLHLYKCYASLTIRFTIFPHNKEKIIGLINLKHYNQLGFIIKFHVFNDIRHHSYGWKKIVSRNKIIRFYNEFGDKILKKCTKFYKYEHYLCHKNKLYYNKNHIPDVNICHTEIIRYFEKILNINIIDGFESYLI